MFERLDHENVVVWVDEEKLILNVTYKGKITSEITQMVYAWIGKMAATHGVHAVKGSLYDFRDVKEFSLGNMVATQSQSRNLNNQVDMSKHPVALIVKSVYQETFVSSTMHVTPQERRKRIVHSESEANSFIAKFLQEVAES